MSLSRPSLKPDYFRKWSFSLCVILWLRAAARSWDLPFSVETHLLPSRQRLNYCNKLHPMSSGAYLISQTKTRIGGFGRKSDSVDYAYIPFHLNGLVNILCKSLPRTPKPIATTSFDYPDLAF